MISIFLGGGKIILAIGKYFVLMLECLLAKDCALKIIKLEKPADVRCLLRMSRNIAVFEIKKTAHIRQQQQPWVIFNFNTKRKNSNALHEFRRLNSFSYRYRRTLIDLRIISLLSFPAYHIMYPTKFK